MLVSRYVPASDGLLQTGKYAGDTLDAALQPFVRIAPDGSERRTGSGLGLAIVQEVMKAHGGRVGFAFPEAAGFAVVLTFPRAMGAS